MKTLITAVIITLSIQPFSNAAVMIAPTPKETITNTNDKGYWTYLKLVKGFNYANLYTNPSSSSSSKVIYQLSNNQKIYVTGKTSGGFREVIVNGQKGYLVIRY